MAYTFSVVNPDKNSEDSRNLEKFPLESEYADSPEENDGEGGKADKRLLSELIQSDNIADLLSKEKLLEVSEKLRKEFEMDVSSLDDKLQYADRIMELTDLHREARDMPFRGAANIKMPMITLAVNRFSSTASNEMLKNRRIADYEIIGNDYFKPNDPRNGKLDRLGIRRSTYLNYQLKEKIPNWRNQCDALHTQLAAIGWGFTKTYYDPIDENIKVDLIPYDHLIINLGITCLENADRITQLVYMTSNQIIEHMRHGVFCTYDVQTWTMDEQDTDAVAHELLEIHCYLDLDGDGYKEPYIVTLHKSEGYILRIVARFTQKQIKFNKKGQVARITPEHYFTYYKFIEDPSGKFLGLGFGTLLLDITEASNTAMNQLLNAGHLATVQGGFISEDLRIKKSDLEIDPGEWLTVNTSMSTQKMQDLIMPLQYKEPSAILFQLLGMMQNLGQSISSTTDVMTGSQEQSQLQNVSPNTVAMMLQQGLKVYSDIQSRIIRARNQELHKIEKLLGQHAEIEDYLKILNPTDQEISEIFQVGKTGQLEFMDYNADEVNICTSVDPNESTKQERLVKAQIGVTTGIQLAQIGGVNPRALSRMFYSAIEEPMVDEIVMPEPPTNQPNPQAVKMQHDMQVQDKQLQIEQAHVQLKSAETQAKVQEMHAKTQKTLSDAQVQQGRLKLDAIKTNLDADMHASDVTTKLHKINSDAIKSGFDNSTNVHMQNQDHAHERTLAEINIAAAPIKAVKQPSQPLNIPPPDAVHQEAVRRGWNPK